VRSGEGGGQSISVENFSPSCSIPTPMWKHGFAPSGCNAMTSGPSYSEIGWARGISPSRLGKIHHAQCVRQKIKAWVFLFRKVTKDIKLGCGPRTFEICACGLVLSQNFDHSSLHFSEEIESVFTLEHSFGFINFIFKFWKTVPARCVTNFFFRLCCMLRQLVFLTNTEMIWHNFVHCQLWNASFRGSFSFIFYG
jgi:hypothetical protein